ncbi:MAG: hypothetical protein PHH75_05475 [Candidatus Omnitrophica bacterium]|nr:hypothetical protein [Candidatus Omnitrophota bacterium]MDD5574611.1 hypothetical protein [Candidatus Omnitrophota bacterium]
MNKLVFIRDDDVWRLTPAFLDFFNYCFDNDIPVVYAVIPARMQSSLVRFLRSQKRQKPMMVDIVQHGWRHVNYQHKDKAPQDDKYEFGPSRFYALQHRDICRGRSKMREAFENDFTDAFVPPFHGYDRATMQVVNACGFKIFSAHKREIFPRRDVVSLPVNLSLNAGDDLRKLMNVFWKQMKSPVRIVGVLGHHEKLKSLRARKEVFNFFSALKKLQKEGACRLTTFSGIAAKRL